MVFFSLRTHVDFHSHVSITVDKSKFSPAGYRLMSSFFEYVYEGQNGRKWALVQISGFSTYPITRNMLRKAPMIQLATVWPLLRGVSFTRTQGTCGVLQFTDLQALQNYELKFMWKFELHVSRYIVFGHMSVAGRHWHAGIQCLFRLNMFTDHD